MIVKTVYTDGSCLGNPGPGGWGYAVPNGKYASGSEAATTNNQMELLAVIRAAEHIKGNLLIYSDSRYICDAFNKGWLKSWASKNWRKSDGQKIANMDMWQHLFALTENREIHFKWVKAHAGDKWNSIADRLALEAAKNQTSDKGKGNPFPNWNTSQDYRERKHYGGSQPATEKQIKYAKSLIEKSGQRANIKELSQMSKSEISDLIDRYKK